MSRTKPPLSTDYIARVALSLINEIGLARFSMRKLGTALGTDPMAVYYYFSDQEALFDGVAEVLFDELDVDSLPWDGTWRGLLEDSYRRMRAALVASPQAVPVFASRPVRSAKAIETGNRTIALLRDAGFAPGTALEMTRALRDYTVGHAMGVAAVQQGDHFELGLAALLDGFALLRGR